MYESYFGFQHAPFSITPDPRFLFRDPRYEEALSTLLYGIRQRKGFMLLTGDVGTGKTTLLHALIPELGNTPFVLVFNPVADFDQLLTLVCDELELAPQRADRPARLASLNRFLTDQLRAGRTTALLIDEGQNLSGQTLEDLRLLTNLETPAEKLLQIVLVGQLELAARIDEPSMRQLRQRIVLRYELKALSVREVGEYVRHRLRTAGATDTNLIAPSAIAEIARLSGGVPRLVNVICDNALLVCFGSSQRQVTSKIVEEVAEDLRLADPVSPGGNPLDTTLHEVERFAAPMQPPAEMAFRATASPPPFDETTAPGALVAFLEALRLRYGALFRYDPAMQTLTMVAQEGLAEPAINAIRVICRGVKGVWEMPLHAVLQRRAYIIEKPKENPFVPTLLRGSAQEELTNAAVIPLFAAGSPTGAVLLVGSGKRAIHETDIFALRKDAKSLAAALLPPSQAASRAAQVLAQPNSSPPRGGPILDNALLTARVSQLESLVESLRRAPAGPSATETERRLAEISRERDRYKSESARHEIALRNLGAEYDYLLHRQNALEGGTRSQGGIRAGATAWRALGRRNSGQQSTEDREQVDHSRPELDQRVR